MNKDKLIEFAKDQCEIFPEDSYMGKYLRETMKMLQARPCKDAPDTNVGSKKQAEPCEDAVSRKDVYFKLTNGTYPNETIEQFIDRLVKELEAMPPVTPTQGWIPVSERLPEERGMYIVTEKVFSITDKEHAGGFNLMTEQAEFDNGKWRRASFYEVIAWMPMLKPYQEEMESEV